MFETDLVKDFFKRKIKFEGIERDLKIPKTNKIISIIGPRRAGKTWYFYFLLQKEKNPMYVNFEDIAFKYLEPEEFFGILKIFSETNYEPKTLFFDEVQNLKNWSILVRSLYDRNFKIFITGSSSKLLSREISTELRGRTLSYLLLPFSFSEFLKAKRYKPEVEIFEKKGTLLKLLRTYLKEGGFPEIVFSENKEKILREYFNEIFYKDFVERHEIKSLEFGRFLFEFCFQNFSKEISFRKIKNFFKKSVSDTTLYEYMEKLQDTLSVFFLEKYEKSIYLRKSWPRKIYVCDLGLANILGFEGDIGKRMENTVFLELLRRTNKKPLMEIFYWKDYQQREVDFVVKEGLKVRQLIQVTYANAKDEIEEREIRGLIKASELLKCKDLLCITWDYEALERIKGRKIRFLPLWKWLLN